MKSQIVQVRASWWLEHVGRWRQSGMSKSGYCAAHGLSLNSFRYWLRKSRSSMDTSPAVQQQPTVVAVPFTLAPKGPSFGLVVADRYALDIPADFDDAALTRLLSVLEARC
jgi:hypothetical protein